MITSNSSIDWTKIMTETDKTAMLSSPEFREWIVSLLSDSNVTITFTKKDGTERIMKCTRNSAFIPTELLPKEGSTEPTSAVPVFDLDAQGWRSFIPSNIIRLEYEL
jgi:hypothetical protein